MTRSSDSELTRGTAYGWSVEQTSFGSWGWRAWYGGEAYSGATSTRERSEQVAQEFLGRLRSRLG